MYNPIKNYINYLLNVKYEDKKDNKLKKTLNN